MSSRLTASVGALVMGAVLLAALSAQTQEHVWLVPQLGTTGIISTVAFSKDGRFLLTGSWDKTARWWDAASGQRVRSFVGHTDGVSSVAFSPDGRFVLTGDADNARLWDAASGQQIRFFEEHTVGVTSVAFSIRCPPGSVSGGVLNVPEGADHRPPWFLAPEKSLDVFTGRPAGERDGTWPWETTHGLKGHPARRFQVRPRIWSNSAEG